MVTHAINQAISDLQPYNIEHRIVRPDKTERFIHTQGIWLHNDAGEIVHIVGTLQDITERKRAQAETLRLLEENRFLIYHSMEIQEDERRHLARELHDEFGQCITAIQADAEAIAELAQEWSSANNVAAKIKISADAILTVSAHIYDVVHTLMRQLRPSGLDELGLVEILQEMVRTWQARHPETRCTLTTQGDLDQLGETVNITLYRVMQECLTNVAKYANASQVTITLEANSGTQQLILKVQDNGRGMSLTKPRQGLGLIGIRERTQALEGHLQLDSSEGQGMTITLAIPIAEEYQQKRRKRQ
jgi:glucose-6-phosphate-specific signal transduction histidine kinase